MAFTFSYVIEETDGVERTYGHRLNGDFFLLSSFPIEHDCPHGARQRDAIGAVKPLSPLDSRGTVHRRHGARNCGSYCRVISGSITDGGFDVLGNGLQVLRRKKAQETRIKEEQRAGVIDKLLSEATKQSESTNATPVKEVAPAK